MARRQAEGVADKETVVLEDPRAIRALAHPARIEIIRALFDGEELTATECARLTGLSPSATSYHLKALARWGIVEPAAQRPDGRDRPWRGKGRSLRVASKDRVAAGVAEGALLEAVLKQDREAALSWVSREAQEPPEWRVLQFVTGEHWVTPQELAEVVAGLEKALELYGERNRRERSAGSRRVRISALVVPLGDPPPSDA